MSNRPMSSDRSDPDRAPLVPERLRAALIRPAGFWVDVRVVAETGSTNADLLAAAVSGAPEGTVLVAEAQTAGQGRLERQWVSPPRSGLTFSLLLRPTVPAPRLAWLPLLAGLAAQRAVSALDGTVPVALKWPNDLLLGPARYKAAGILAQATGSAVVIGIGLNVTNRRDELPRADATSLALEHAKTDREALLIALLDQLAAGYMAWQRADGDPDETGLRSAYAEVCDTVGRQVSVSLPSGQPLAGAATGIDESGRLLVRDAAGRQHAVAAGDVVHVR